MNLKVAAVMMAKGLALLTKTAKQLTSGNVHFWGPHLYPCDHGNESTWPWDLWIFRSRSRLLNCDPGVPEFKGFTSRGETLGGQE